MKKLMIAAAIVCAAAFAQAATFLWDGYDITDINGGSYTGTAILHCVEIASLTDTSHITSGELAFSSLTSDLLEKDSTYNFYFTSTDSAGNTYKSETVSAKMPKTGSATGTFEGLGTWTKKPDPEPTPEPTSAMLMLLGMAGLALKRKQK